MPGGGVSKPPPSPWHPLTIHLPSDPQLFFGNAPKQNASAPAAANPYIPVGPGYGLQTTVFAPTDPFAMTMPYSPIGGSQITGGADFMRAYGDSVAAEESARVVREVAVQAKLRTKKAAFDLDRYVRDNTPTYTEEQEKIVKTTLRRIQSNSLPGEIANGKALNILLDDLRKFPNREISLEPLQLSEATLKQLNVTKGTLSVGALRDSGQVVWPAALGESTTGKRRQRIEKQLQEIVTEANEGRVAVQTLKDVRSEIEQVRAELVKKVNDISPTQYLAGKRFLQELDDATRALEKGESACQANFQRFVEQGRSIQDVTDYLVKEGLRFGAATARDEAAYRTVHAALATYDIAINAAK
jgi:hypothetical protein